MVVVVVVVVVVLDVSSGILWRSTRVSEMELRLDMVKV